MPDEDLPPDAPVTPSKVEPAAKPAEKKPVEVTSPSVVSRHVGPLAMGIGAIALGGLGVGLGLNARSLETQAKVSMFESDYLATRGQAQGNAIGADVAFAVAGALALAAIVVLIMQQ